MLIAANTGLLVAMLLTLIRLFKGPSLYDRTLAVNAFGTKTVLLIGALGFLTGRPDFLDIALIYALINFIGTIAILKFLLFHLSFELANSRILLLGDRVESDEGEEERG